MKTEIFKKIILDLQDDSFFAGYKFIKSERTLFFHNEDDTVSLILEHWRDYYDNTCVIRPIYGRHFNVLSKWFEKYNLKPLRQQRIAPQIMIDNNSFGQDQEIEFKYDFSDYEEKFQKLLVLAKRNISSIIENYATINDFYKKIIKPQTLGKKELPEAGADWIFVYLTAAYLIDRENYPTLKGKILGHAEWLLNHHELNVADYYDRLDEIITYMENTVKL